MKPILRYYGAKSKIAPWIIDHMPPHRVYLEPFAGSLAVLLNKPPVAVETANDLDGDVINFFQILRDRPEDLARSIALTPYARQEFKVSYEQTEDGMERARRFAVRCWMAMGARASGKPTGYSRSCTGQGSNKAHLWSRVPETVLEAAQRLKRVQFECRDAVQLIREYDSHDTLIYCDPPYISPERTNPNQYKHEMYEEQHRELLQALKASKAMVMLSGYSNPLYEAELPGWHIESLPTVGEHGARRTERLWINPEAWSRVPKLTLEQASCGG